ncbi:MAG: hypothetical protein GZ094_13565 [Mariniphaga sp.]|nr:hypothetical protein [Mariniphaga sp.]
MAVTTVNGMPNLHESGTVEASLTIPLTFQRTGTVKPSFIFVKRFF